MCFFVYQLRGMIMGIFGEDEAIAVEESRREHEEREEKARQARINRAKLDTANPYVYVAGPVFYIPAHAATESDPAAIIYAFDLLALRDLWQEKDGLLVPKDSAGLLKDCHGKISDWGVDEPLRARPYLCIQSLRSEQEGVLEQAVDGTLRVDYSDKPHDHFTAKVFSNSLFDAEGTGKIQLSGELHPDLEARAEKIIAFYKELKAKE